VENPVISPAARRLAERALGDRPDEARLLLDAGRAVMRRCGTASRPKVADIVRAAGLSNDAFYRHFASKDALVAAILRDGGERLRSYLDHQMAKADDAEGQVHRWVEGVLAQAADEEAAAATLAVLWNAGSIADAAPEAMLAPLLHAPLTELGSDDPHLHAALVAHAVVGRMSDHLTAGTKASRAETRRIVDFALATVRA
jgi:AcrR family transcriptional regulator